MRLVAGILGLLYLAVAALADTEIVNFQLPFPSSSIEHNEKSISGQIHPLISIRPSQPIITNLSTSFPEQRFIIDFEDEDQTYNKWTIRASWPGSSPTRITLNPPDSSGQFSVTGSALSPRMHHPLLHRIFSKYIHHSSQSNRDAAHKDDQTFNTPISVILEPLILGVIPKTALPTIGIIILFVVIVGLNISRIIRLMEKTINSAASTAGHEKED